MEINPFLFPTINTQSLPDPIVDEVSATVIYIGYAPIGTPLDEAKWFIKKVEKVGTVTTISYAEGSLEYKFIWNSRATYTYQR